MTYRRMIVRKRLAALIACSLIATSVPIPTQAASEGSLVNPVYGAFAPVGAFPSGVTAEGGLARYQEAAPEPGTDVWVDPATADPAGVNLPAADQGIAPAPTEAWVEPVPTDAATEPFIKETPAETSVPLDPAPSESIEPAPVDPAFPASEVKAAPAETLVYPVSSADPIDPATGAWVEPAPVAPIPAEPVPGVAPAPVDMGVAGGSEPWGQPIATAFIAGTNGQGVPCHAGPAWEAAPLTVLGEGEAVEVRAETVGEWQPVNCAGVGGYVPVALIAWTPVAPADPVAVDGGLPEGKTAAGGTGVGGDQIANFALQYQGYPYIYAGEGPYAFDCSGFTMFVIQNTLGIDVPHDMTVQYAMGQPVSREALQPGDLVFFANTFRPGMSHNGVYIGGGQFVHAETESSGVTVSDLNDDYYGARWYGAVRFS